MEKATKAEGMHAPGHTGEAAPSGFEELVLFQKLVFVSQPEHNGKSIPIYK